MTTAAETLAALRARLADARIVRPAAPGRAAELEHCRAIECAELEADIARIEADPAGWEAEETKREAETQAQIGAAFGAFATRWE